MIELDTIIGFLKYHIFSRLFLNHKPPRSIKYLLFLLTSLSTLYSFYKFIFIS